MRFWTVAAASLCGIGSLAASAAAANVTVAPGDNIQVAINNAAPGDTIVIKPGVYNQAFTVNVQLNFKGSPGKTILDGAGLQGPICQLNASGCAFTGLLFRFSDPASAAVVVNGAQGASFSKCTFHGTGGYALYVIGNDLRVTRCVFVACSEGVYLETGSGAVFTGNRYAANSDYGAEVYGPSTFLKETCENGLEAGWYFGATCTLSGAKVRRSYGAAESGGSPGNVLVEGVVADLLAQDAIDLDGPSSTIRGCKVRNAGSTAFYISGSDALIQDNSSFFCGTGTEAYGTNTRTLGNSVVMCDDGIYLGVSSSGGLAEGNTLRDIFGSGIDMNDHPDGTIRGNTLTRIGGFGDYFEAGIRVLASANATVEANRIGDVDGGQGILILGSNGADVLDNEIDGVAFNGILLYGDPYILATYPTRFATVRGNSVSDCNDPFGGGILLFGVTDSTIDANTVSGVDGVGIGTFFGDDCTLSGNEVTGTGKDGILVGSSYTAGNIVVEGNTVRGAHAEGIQNDAGGVTPTTIRNNSVTGSGLRPFANSGTVNVGASTGNSPQPADWNAIPPQHYL